MVYRKRIFLLNLERISYSDENRFVRAFPATIFSLSLCRVSVKNCKLCNIMLHIAHWLRIAVLLMSIANARQSKLRLKDNGFSSILPNSSNFLFLDDVPLCSPRTRVLVFTNDSREWWKRTKFNIRNLYFYKKSVRRESVCEMCEMSIIKNDSLGSLLLKLMHSVKTLLYFDNHLMSYAHQNLSQLSQLCWNLINSAPRLSSKTGKNLFRFSLMSTRAV